MPTPDASQYTTFRRYASVAGDALASAGSKISPFNTSYSIPMLTASSQSLFLPSANKEKKFAPVPGIPGPIWVREIGMGSTYTEVYGTTVCNDGTIVVCGETVLQNFPHGPDVFDYPVGFVARYTSSGSFISGFSLGSGNTNVWCINVTVDAQGNMYVVGGTYENLTAYREYREPVGFAAKISSDLNVVWLNEYGSGFYYSYAYAILYAPNDQLYISVLTTEEPSDWENPQEHSGIDGQLGLIFNLEAGSGEILSGVSVGDGIGYVYLDQFVLLPSGAYGGEPGITPNLIAVLGNSNCLSLDGVTEGVPGVDNAGGGDRYGFVWIFDEDLAPGPYAGIGSGNNRTRIYGGGLFTFLGLPEALIACGDTNEYLYNWMGGTKGELLAQGGRVGMTYFIVPGGQGIQIIPAATIGTEGNDTYIGSISADYFGNVYLSGTSNENVKESSQYSGQGSAAFALKTLVCGETVDYIQVGTGNSYVRQYGQVTDILGNSYFSGTTYEKLPEGPDLGQGVHGFLAKSFTQPSNFNSPIFMVCDTSVKGGEGDGVCSFNITFTGTLTVDWGYGIVETFESTGDLQECLHVYSGYATIPIAIDVSQGGSITKFDCSEGGLFTIDVTQCPTLTYLRVNGNSLTDVDVAHCKDLTLLEVQYNYLYSLDVSYLAGLNVLQCSDNLIKILHLENCGLSSQTDTTLEYVIDNINDGNTDVTIYIDPLQNSGFEGGASVYFGRPAWFFFMTPGFPSLGTASYQFPQFGRGVAYGNGIFVAVGNSLGDTGAAPTNVLVSIDGGKSFKIPTGITSNLFPGGYQPLARSVCYAYNGVWVVSGDDSTNGLSGQTLKFSIDNAGTWYTCSGAMPGQRGTFVLFNNDRYDPLWVATGSANNEDWTIFTSTDGINWSGVDTQFGSGEGRAIAYGNGTWVVSGRNSSNQPLILYSTDSGSSWLSADIPEELMNKGSSRHALAFGYDQNGNAQFVLTLESSAFISSDGTEWNVAIDGQEDTSHIWQPPPFANNPSNWNFGSGLVYYNKTWMFASGNYDKPPFFASDPTSTDSGTYGGWRVGQTGAIMQSYANSVAAGDKNWVVVGSLYGPGNTIISSTDGITWAGSEISPPVLGAPNDDIYGTGTVTVNQTGGKTFQWRFLDVPENPSSGNLFDGEASYHGNTVYNLICSGTQTDTLTIQYSSTPPSSILIACVVTNGGGSVTSAPITVSNTPPLSNLVVANLYEHYADLTWTEGPTVTSRTVQVFEQGTQNVVNGAVSGLTAGACTITGVGNNSPGWGPYDVSITSITSNASNITLSITVSISCFLGSTKLQTRRGAVQASDITLGTELLQPDGSYSKVVNAKQSVVSKAVPAGDARLFADPDEKMIVSAWHKIRFADDKDEIKADVHPRLHEVFREMPFQVYHFELEDISHKILIADTDIIAESFSPNQAW
jgi:hypothetical protein